MKVDSELWSDINVVASILKLFLRKLPRCLLTPGMFPSLRHTIDASVYFACQLCCQFVAFVVDSSTLGVEDISSVMLSAVS